MGLPLAVKASAVVTLIIGLALALIIMLNYLKFEQTLRVTTGSRLGFIAEDLKSSIQTGLDLGLALTSMTNVQPIIEREAAEDARILGIDVFDDRGVILFSTEDGVAGNPIAATWQKAIEGNAATVWQATGPDQIVVGSRLTSNFGFEVGGVALRYSRASFEQQLQKMFDLLATMGVVTLVIAGVLSLIVSWLVFGRMSRSLFRVRTALEMAIRRPEAAAFRPRRQPLEEAYAQVEQRLRGTLGPSSRPGEGAS